MEQLVIGRQNPLKTSKIGLGCMRLNQLSTAESVKVLETAYEQGINFFDHADIYGGGQCETLFAESLKKTSFSRSDIYLQSKCGIRKIGYDLSYQHIISSVDQILKRLNTDYLDSLLLHRPDTLMEPEEVARAFDELTQAGKVRNFGISNFSVGQMKLLKASVKQPLTINQIQFSLMHTGLIDQGINVNLKNEASLLHDDGLLDYMRLKEMTIQAWSPLQFGFFEGSFIENKQFLQLNQVLDQLAETYHCSPVTIAIAWILRHPANFQPIVGTMNSEHLKEITQATDIKLTLENWYGLYKAAGNSLP